MTISRIGVDELTQVQQLWQRSRYHYQNLGDEDLADLLKDEIALLGVTEARPALATAWGFLALQAEARPATLPAAAPDRAYLRAVALARGHHPSLALPPLLDAAQQHLQQLGGTHLFVSYGEPDWLYRTLFQAGFTLAEEVQFLALPYLSRWQPPTPALTLVPTALQLRAGQPSDLPALAILDAEVFPPLWHMGVVGLQGLLLLGRLQVAHTEGQLVGYSALNAAGSQAHLSRLAVHPAWQGHGYGRVLLYDALVYAQHEGVNTVMLNTQVENAPAQQLYRQTGFQPTGQVLPVLTKVIAAAAPAPTPRATPRSDPA